MSYYDKLILLRELFAEWFKTTFGAHGSEFYIDDNKPWNQNLIVKTA